MKKLSLSVVATSMTLAFAASAYAQEVVVKIGHVAPISGAQSHYGKDNENGARLAITDLNAKKITIGGKPVKFELVPEDDAADPKQGTQAAQKLVDAKVNGVVGHLNSGTTIPASRIYHDAGIPQITPAATNPKYAQQGFKSAFRIIANDNALGAATAIYAAKTLKAKKVAVIDDRTAYGQGIADIFEKTAKAQGMQVAGRQFTNDKATDFQAILTAIKAAKPDVVFYGGMDPQAGPMLRQMKQLGINAKMMGGDGICTEELVKLGGAENVGSNVICAVGGSDLAKMPGGPDFQKRFKEAYKMDIQVYAPYAYDAVMALATAMQKANSTDPKKYLAELAKLDMKGVTGRVQFESNGELKNAAVTLFTYKDGKKVALN
jgi:branched-chain amino acid transport system substrate-binding protein